MKINEIIRTLRKEQNLTQEQVANYLGVTAPAVNKWENGITYPDITLLAPLARLLKTDVDTLLSFHEELTDLEINQFIKEISSEITKLGFEQTFEKASRMIKQYPNCDKLIIYAAQILNGYLVMKDLDVKEKEKYAKQIKAWFEMVSSSKDKELANRAILSLSQNYTNAGQYEEAQKLLDQIPPAGFDKRIVQANLYHQQGMLEKAYKVHEEMLYQFSNSVVATLMQIITLLCEEKEYEEALRYSELIVKTSESFDLGTYTAAGAKFMIYVKQQKVEESLEAIKDLLHGIDTLGETKNSKLYQHMKMKDCDGIKEMKEMILTSMQTDSELSFLRDNVQFKMLTQ